MLLTKANVKGHRKTNAGRFGFVGRGARFTELPTVTEAKGGDGLSEQWSESCVSQLQDLESADHVCSRVPRH